MEIKPPPRLVTLYTQVFDSYNFNYNSQALRTLVTLAQQEKIRLLLTSVTLHEIRAHIIEGAELASKAVEQAINDLNKKRFKPQGDIKRIKISANSDLLYDFRKKEENFSDLDFSIDLSGTSLIEWGSEEIEVKVNSVDIIDSSLVHVDDSDSDQPSVVFELEAEVNYDANVSYRSLEYAIYDREYDMYYGGETVDTVFTQSIKLNVEVTLILSRDKDYSFCDADVDDITIDPNNTLGEIVIDTGFADEYY